CVRGSPPPTAFDADRGTRDRGRARAGLSGAAVRAPDARGPMGLRLLVLLDRRPTAARWPGDLLRGPARRALRAPGSGRVPLPTTLCRARDAPRGIISRRRF